MALGPGSIAFTGYVNLSSLNFNFVALTDLAAGTVINFTDTDWRGGTFQSPESTWTWTAASDVAAGTTVTLENLTPSVFLGPINATSNLGTVTYSGPADAGFSAETLYAYVGDSSSPTFLSAFSTWPYYSNQSLLDGTGLTEGVSAVNVFELAKDSAAYVAYIAAYHGPTSGFTTFADFQIALNNIDNWSAQHQVNDHIDSDGIAPDLPLSTASFTIDPTAQTIGFALDSVRVSTVEGQPGDSHTLTFHVVRSGATTGAVDFHGSLVIAPDSGINAADFGGTLPTFSGTIADGATSATVTIAISGDIHSEADEVFKIALDSVSNSQATAIIGGANSATATIVNDDVVQTLQFAENSRSFEVTEGDSGTQTLTFTVERIGGAPIGDLHFTVGLYFGNVTADDFGGTLPTAVTGTILDGQTSGTFTITVAGDTRYEANDSFTLVFTSASNDPVGAVFLAPYQQGGASQGTILNNDPAPTGIAAGQVAEGQIIITGNDHFVVGAGGLLADTNETAMLWTGSNSHATIDNFGSIASYQNNALGINSNVTGTLVVNNHVGSLIADEMNMRSLKTGQTVTINNEGVLGGGYGYAVEMSTSGGVVILNNLATGVIVQETANTDVLKNGNNGIINNYGKIASIADIVDENGLVLEYGGDAIDVGSGIHDTVHNFAGGLIEGSRHAVTGKRDITVINEAGGTIIGRNGSAVNMDNNASVANAAHVTNHGTLIGASAGYEDSDGDAIDADGLLYLDNYGVVKGTGANGYHDGEGNVSEGVAAGGGVINNYAGGEIHGYGRAIEIDNSSNGPALAATTIYNEGLIQGDGHGPAGVTPEEVALFAARMSGGEAVNIIGNFADTLTNFGLIRGGVSMGGGDDLLINHGTMIATGGSAINMGEGNDGLFLGAGSVVAGAILMGGGNDYAVAIGAAASIAGGAGDDFYDIANAAVVVIENVGEGFDKVVTGVNYTLAAGSEVEWLQANAGDTGLTLTGNELYNILVGGNGVDTLNGGGGNDELHGMGGADHLNGGTGDDVYYVADTSDIVTEQVGQGFDKVLASANFTLAEGSEVEWLQANSGATGLTLTGNAMRNTIVGGDGADTLNGGGGPDALFGGAGADSFVFNLGQANGDQVLDFSVGDHLDFFGYGASAMLAQVGNTDAYLITPDVGHGGATAAEVIHITNVFGLNPADYLFH